MSESQKPEQQAASPKEPAPSSTLPSSPGDSPRNTVPKDVSPQDAAWADLSERKITSGSQQDHDEALLDEAIEESFPASDPITELPEKHGSSRQAAQKKHDEEEESLDDAIEMTFPASDPIAIPSSDEMNHERDLRQGRHT